MSDISQYDFSGGMSARLDSTKTPRNAYRVGINCRIRENAIVGAFKPRRIKTPSEKKHQAIFSFDDELLAVLGGLVYRLNAEGEMEMVSSSGGVMMSPTVDYVYHENVPAPSNFFTAKAGEEEPVYNSVVAQVPECCVLQDGVTQPALILPDLVMRRAGTYVTWSFNNPEYIPIGKQMATSGNKLFIAAPDGKSVFQSVSGRQTDFVINITNDGEKAGDATTTPVVVAAATLIGLVPAQGSGFLGFTYYQGYSALPDPLYPDLFGEPYIKPDRMFPVGAVSQYGFTFIKGESAFVSSAGIQAFNQVLQIQNESNNSPIGAAISPYLKRPITDAACCVADDYVFFGVSTIFGDGIIVYDTQLDCFVSIDLVGKIKEFAVLRTSGLSRVFYITTANELYELPLYSGKRGTFAVYFGEFSSQVANTQVRSADIQLAFTDVHASGEVTTRVFTDKQLTNSESYSLISVSPVADRVTYDPQLFPLGNGRQNTPISIHTENAPFGYAIGIEVSCSADAKLVSIFVGTADRTTPRSATEEGQLVELQREVFLAVGNIFSDHVITSGCSMEAVIGREYIVQSLANAPAKIQNGGEIIVVPANSAKRFVARANILYFDADVTAVYDYTALASLLARAPDKKRALFMLGTVGNEPVHAHAFTLFAKYPCETVAVAGALEYASDASALDYHGRSQRPSRYIYSTTYVDFYCMSIAPSDVDGLSSTGSFATWLASSIAERANGKFAVVVMGIPSYSDTLGYGTAALQWNFRAMGVHVVLSSSGAYERRYLNNVYYFNVGTGRATPELLATANGLSVQGILQLTATPTILSAEFYDTSGTARDAVTIVG